MKNKFKNKFLVVSLIALSVFFVGKNFARGESVIEILQGKIENNTNEISKID